MDKLINFGHPTAVNRVFPRPDVNLNVEYEDFTPDIFRVPVYFDHVHHHHLYKLQAGRKSHRKFRMVRQLNDSDA